MKGTLILALLFLSTSFAQASAELSKEDETKIQAKAVMGGVYETFIKVIPYVYSDEESLLILKKDPKAKEELLKNLGDLSTFFKSARHVEYFQRPGFRPSLDTMNDHLADTINSVNSNNFLFAQKRLSALTSLCISCHSQLSPKGQENAFSALINKSKREDFKSDYDYGNYLYLIRNFNESEKFLDLATERALKESRSHELYSSLRRMISMYTKISFDYEKAKSFTGKYKSDERMPKLAKEMVTSWDLGLEEWKTFKPGEVKSIDKFIKTHLSPLEEVKELAGEGKNDITLLVASGVLSKYLNDHPKTKNTPEILYWISVAERRLSNTYFFTISDLYLKDCVKLYSKSPFARKCYNLYENNIESAFSGSGGMDIPPSEKNELARLRGLLK
nr:hypothetical protein BHI3_17930 [Bacteriovorax sp. HI3]